MLLNKETNKQTNFTLSKIIYGNLRVFHWSLNDNKSSQVSRTLRSILADLNNDTAWIVSSCPVIFKSSSPCANPLVTVPSAPMTTGITVTLLLLLLLLLIIIILLLVFEFFQPALSDDFALDFE